MEQTSRSSDVERPIAPSTRVPRNEITDTKEESEEPAAEDDNQETDKAPIATATRVA